MCSISNFTGIANEGPSFASRIIKCVHVSFLKNAISSGLANLDRPLTLVNYPFFLSQHTHHSLLTYFDLFLFNSLLHIMSYFFTAAEIFYLDH